jgi:hypothetical protein
MRRDCAGQVIGRSKSPVLLFKLKTLHEAGLQDRLLGSQLRRRDVSILSSNPGDLPNAIIRLLHWS